MLNDLAAENGFNELRSDSGACVCSSEPGCVIVANSIHSQTKLEITYSGKTSLTSSLHLGWMSHLCVSLIFYGGFIWICIPSTLHTLGHRVHSQQIAERGRG